MKAKKVALAVFTGTGNTLMMASHLATCMENEGISVSLSAMDREGVFDLPQDAALGLALPVACFSTYPTVWRFIDALPAGEGREVFLLATMGGVAFGMDGPIRRAVQRKGYEAVGSCILAMPSNYGNRPIPAQENDRRIAIAQRGVERFSRQLLEARAKWQGGGFTASFFAWLAHGRKPWNLFYKMFPLRVNEDKCVGCELCRDLCPEKNIYMREGKAVIGDRCQSCQRCIGFCPCDAIHVPGKPAERYCAVALEALRATLK